MLLHVSSVQSTCACLMGRYLLVTSSSIRPGKSRLHETNFEGQLKDSTQKADPTSLLVYRILSDLLQLGENRATTLHQHHDYKI